ncbi:MAG: NAD(P)/FAD-dependent oxidoreductase [Bacteroidota bacterium]|nr:NAD(P)/FAD-dependent oxidoreductase [Bacteroidota bacterium]
MIYDYDCAIVGGGLAGLTLSIQLAQKGIKTIVFEKEKYPFHKVCGEYISMESFDFVEKCGVPLSQMHVPRITELNVSAPSGKMITSKLNPGGFGISRYVLDDLLAQKARELGVIVMDGNKVIDVITENGNYSVVTENQLYTTNTVIGSWGKRSNMDVKLNRKFIQKHQPVHRNYVGVKYHVKFPLANNIIQLHNFENGYCGISKVDNDICCLCYLTTAEYLQKFGTIKKLQEAILFKNPHLRNIFTNAEFLFDSPLSISQINFSNKSQNDINLIYLGDAAGMIAPLCGNGMSMAMHASKIASGVLLNYFNGKISKQEIFQKYNEAWKKEFTTRINVGRMIQYLFGKPQLTDLVISSIKPFPKVVSGLISLTHGKAF